MPWSSYFVLWSWCLGPHACTQVFWHKTSCPPLGNSSRHNGHADAAFEPPRALTTSGAAWQDWNRHGPRREAQDHWHHGRHHRGQPIVRMTFVSLSLRLGVFELSSAGPPLDTQPQASGIRAPDGSMNSSPRTGDGVWRARIHAQVADLLLLLVDGCRGMLLPFHSCRREGYCEFDGHVR